MHLGVRDTEVYIRFGAGDTELYSGGHQKGGQFEAWKYTKSHILRNIQDLNIIYLISIYLIWKPSVYSLYM